MEHHQTVARPQAPQAVGQLFGVYVPIFNNPKSSKFPFSINFTYHSRKTIYLQIYQKITKKFTKRPKT